MSTASSNGYENGYGLIPSDEQLEVVPDCPVIGHVPATTESRKQGVYSYAGRWFVLTGAHVVVYSRNAEADRAFFKDILGFRSVDAGHGWLIFAVPAAEVAFHPHDQNNKPKCFFTCDNLKAQVAALQKKGARVGKISEERWGTRTTISLPGGGAIGLYEPKHPVTFERNFAKKKAGQTSRPKKR